MQAAPIRGGFDLFATAEPVGDDEGTLRSFSYFRKQDTFAALHRNIVVPVFEAERAGHAAASGVRHFVVHAEFFERFLFGVHFHDGLMVAMAMHDGAGVQLRRMKVRSLLLQKFTQ